ncbi:MAG: hypothetical protein KDM64_11280, partial [Verrucomicrobiae bacterium]|nr:hypothetical protein [Verrucomicrobiae bacterium]
MAGTPAEPAKEPTDSGTVVEGFASLFQESEKRPVPGGPNVLPWEPAGKAGNAGAVSAEPVGIANPMGSPTTAPSSFGDGTGSGWTHQAGSAPIPAPAATGTSAGKSGKSTKPLSLSAKGERKIFSPFVITVMVLGGLFLAGVFGLKWAGGVDGLKSKIQTFLQQTAPETGLPTAAQPPAMPANQSPEPTAAPATPTAPAQNQPTPPPPVSNGTVDQPVPAIQVPAAPSPAATSQPGPAQPVTEEGHTEKDPFIPTDESPR